MGLVNSGIPREIVVTLASIGSVDAFVETGTFRGDTARWAAGNFSTVHTIELAQELYETYHDALDQIPGVTTHLGDSAHILPQVIAELGEQAAVFWLDGHWSGGQTAGESQECPLMAELEALQQRQQDIVLIDDARLFLAAPPAPHKPEHWPTIADISVTFGRGRFVQVIDDVIFMLPDTADYRRVLIAHVRSMASKTSNQAKRPKLTAFANRLFAR